MNKEGAAVRWVAVIVSIIMLAFVVIGAVQSSILKRVDNNTTDVRRIDKNQAVILFQLKGINGKLDKLLEVD